MLTAQNKNPQIYHLFYSVFDFILGILNKDKLDDIERSKRLVPQGGSQKEPVRGFPDLYPYGEASYALSVPAL